MFPGVVLEVLFIYCGVNMIESVKQRVSAFGQYDVRDTVGAGRLVWLEPLELPPDLSSGYFVGFAAWGILCYFFLFL